MSVTNYTPSSSACKYSYSKLKDVIYLVSKNHTKNVYIDNGEAYIDGLTELPLRLNGFNISLKEESSLDERYAFSKTVTLSMHGYVNSSIFDDRYYVILESYDGTFWMVNTDFPAKLTYTFNLAKDTYQTDFTLSLVSNFPTLRLVNNFDAVSPVCIGFNVYGIKSLKLLEKDYCTLESVNKTVTTYGKSFQDVEFLGDSCSFQETFDGDKVTTTISFDIGFDAYKSSWHYNLLEFIQNLYAAIVEAKGDGNTFLAGFNFGLQPSFVVQTQSNQGQSDIITITLTEASNHGSTAAVDWEEEQSTETMWAYVKWVGAIKCYECISLGNARYLVQQELTPNGVPTGKYKCLAGYESYFTSQGLNIIGTFSDTQAFSNSDCTGDSCSVITDIPTSITYRTMTCNTYSYSASCNWNVNGLASYMTVTPSNGVADSAYTLTVCNTKIPTTNESSTFRIKAGNNIKIVNVNLTTESAIINPSSVTINCLAQNVTFTFNASCPVTVTSIDARLTYNMTNSQLIVQVPRNNSTESGITWSITVKDCHNNTATVTIIQDKTYEQWVATSDYICESGSSYVKENRYTGTTSTDINTPTGESRKGSLIQQGDPRCQSTQTRWAFNGNYYCLDGDKYKVEEEEISYDGGTTWNKTGLTRLGELVEASSSFCEETVEYEWRLTTKWQCGYDARNKLIATYAGGTTYSAECDSATTLTSGDTRPTGYTYSAMTSAVIGCVTSIGERAFSGCSSLSSCTIGSGVTTIDGWAFAYCYRLTSIDIPSGVTSIGNGAFTDCTGLTSVTIPDSVTSIGDNAFNACTGLTSVTIPDSVTSIQGGAFYWCTSLTSIDIPNSVTSIGSAAFDACSGLTSCTIGSGVTNIDSFAFTYCSGLNSITVRATTPPTLGKYAFYSTNDCPIYVPSGSVNTYKSASGWSDLASRIQAIP